MRSLKFCYIVCSFAWLGGYAQPDPCDSELLLQTSKGFTSLYESHIRSFLATFKDKCDSEEYKEWRNELLFDILERYPDNVIQLLGTRSLPVKVILEELKSPVSDGIDFEKLITKVEDSKVDSQAKQQVLESLKAASIK